jgi:flavin reductase (DIM6/NTAB) family NADH-FMN oxidoreductase RutF
VGFTAISVAAASVDPPMLTFTIGRSSSSLDVLTAELRFAVHLLSAGQADAARRFADDARARFADPTTWSWGDDGLPVLADTAARASGSVVWMTDAGDSLLVLGRVESATGTDREPLLHHDRQYIGLTRARPEGDHR